MKPVNVLFRTNNVNFGISDYLKEKYNLENKQVGEVDGKILKEILKLSGITTENLKDNQIYNALYVIHNNSGYHTSITIDDLKNYHIEIVPPKRGMIVLNSFFVELIIFE